MAAVIAVLLVHEVDAAACDHRQLKRRSLSLVHVIPANFAYCTWKPLAVWVGGGWWMVEGMTSTADGMLQVSAERENAAHQLES